MGTTLYTCTVKLKSLIADHKDECAKYFCV